MSSPSPSSTVKPIDISRTLAFRPNLAVRTTSAQSPDDVSLSAPGRSLSPPSPSSTDDSVVKEAAAAQIESESTMPSLPPTSSVSLTSRTRKSDLAIMSPPATPQSTKRSSSGKTKYARELDAPRPPSSGVSSSRDKPPVRLADTRTVPNPSRLPDARDFARPLEPEQIGGVVYSSSMAPRTFRGRYELRGDTSRGFTEYGKGAWSIVYQALYREPITTRPSTLDPSLPSPPESPYGPGPKGATGPRIIAVKSPLAKTLEDPKPILQKEARILTYLHSGSATRVSQAQQHVVSFFGFDGASNSLVFEALPLTLAAFTQQRARSVKDDFSTQSMLEPLVGPRQWLHFATHLVAGLDFLHGEQVVHGDVKPMNILLRVSRAGPTDPFAEHGPVLDPIYCDFSSSHVMQDRTDQEEISAVTTSYTAPELLEAFHHRSGERAVATPAADIYALAATLLVPAIGEDLYANVSSSYQKLALARHGHPLDTVRQGEQASRVMKGKLVDRALGGALKKDLAQRWTASAWVAQVSAELRDWKRGKRDG
ncbi:MAG: hypothetical protein M1838_006165 [Thelocarpon superellum]|nr:MAG: hypothetical protein M1838_006165 [Thelocarpon superellum]